MWKCVVPLYQAKIMAGAKAVLQFPCKLSVVSTLLSRNGGWIAHLQCTRRAVGTLRSKAEEMKDGYNTKRDSHLDGKTPEEVIKELLSHKRIDPTDRKNTRSAKSKQYALKGKASGIDPSIMWPTKRELEVLKEEERYYCTTLEEMQAELYLEKKRKELEELREQKHIEKCMARLPKLEAEHQKKEEEKRKKEEESKKKKAELLEMAREKLGYAIDPRSQRFKEMVEEMEKEERKKKKALKKKGVGL
ncbi:Growth arrest and DNA damage-inducible proteins-interacting protein 1 [Holothuria leucospilota]|uniref:Large ribosomal subunit protein mL64 n=1 Tax=Holothuria leucospilota TaxID=206669 RepID=A0A9Q1HD01_HOLLE|nr:Growth arrest and DNA damage-inducible proteins-interacting protein 1 [Holothuria leucospilota]